MSSWICNNCDARFEGGLFNTRNCPHCHSSIKDFFKIVWFCLKVALVIIPVLFILRFFKIDLYNSVIRTAANIFDYTTVVYYNPSLYFNNIVYVKDNSYYVLHKDLPFLSVNAAAQQDQGSNAAPGLNEGQNVLVKGVLSRNENTWIAAEYYHNNDRKRAFLVAPKSWDSVMSIIDFGAVMSRAKIEFRNAVLAALPFKEVAGKEYITKFSEINPEYYRLDIEDTSFLSPLFKMFSPQYEVAYFVQKADKEKVEELRSKYLDSTVIEKDLLKLK